MLGRLSFGVLLMVFFSVTIAKAQIAADAKASDYNRNNPKMEEWLQDAGFGLFMHWSMDSQLGTVISHTIVGSSEDYQDRYYNELPKTFNPNKYDAMEVARLAKLSGAKYMVLTTKHHSGFCMWDTKTTDFNIMNTPYQKDIVKEYVDACRKMGLKVGFYYSPEDWLFLRKKGALIKRRNRDVIAKPFRKEYDVFMQDQLRELLTNYGKIDIMFLDGGYWPPAKKICWEIQPDILITRGALNSPEQTVADVIQHDAWEACITMNNQWAYKPTNKKIKHGTRLIEILIETRCKGGALVLNVGPKPNGELDIVEEETLREVAAWNFVNSEALYNVRPWIIARENNIWFSKSKDSNTIYAYITKIDWERGDRKKFLLKSVKATANTKISVVGQNDLVCEYQYIIPTSKYNQSKAGLEISVVRAQRIYNANDWDNPIVVKLENVEPAMEPVTPVTMEPVRTSADRITMKGSIDNAAKNQSLRIGFKYRVYGGFHESIYSDKWESTPLKKWQSGKVFETKLKKLDGTKDYQIRTVVEQNGVIIEGKIIKCRKLKQAH
ncbi:alpha-L-fucosidase [Prolixibacteraceae bacterium JC049]|nr:alpha-L-fucosidase [Prolixibacteraceae bacterium JC049]